MGGGTSQGPCSESERGGKVDHRELEPGKNPWNCKTQKFLKQSTITLEKKKSIIAYLCRFFQAILTSLLSISMPTIFLGENFLAMLTVTCDHITLLKLLELLLLCSNLSCVAANVEAVLSSKPLPLQHRQTDIIFTRTTIPVSIVTVIVTVTKLCLLGVEIRRRLRDKKNFKQFCDSH